MSCVIVLTIMQLANGVDGSLELLVSANSNAMSKYSGVNSSYSCISDTKIHVTGQEDQNFITRVDYLRNGDQYLFSMQDVGNKSSNNKIMQYTISRSNRYMYQAQKNKENKWIVAELIRPAPDYKLSFEKIQKEDIRKVCLMYFNDKREYNIYIVKQRLAGLQTASLRLLEGHESKLINDTDSQTEYAISFKREYSYWKKPLKSSGTVVINKNKEQRISSFHIISKDDNFEIQDTYNAKEILIDKNRTITRSNVVESVTINGRAVQKTVINSETVESCGDVPESKFLLAEIGVTEPGQLEASNKWLPWHVLLAITGAAILCLAILLLHIRRRADG